jgi:hypothetical protein
LNLLFLLPVFLLVSALVLLFWWSTRSRRKAPGQSKGAGLEDAEKNHAIHCAQIRQALSRADLEYLAAAGGTLLAKRVRIERRRIAAAYVTALGSDFYQLVRLGKVIAKLSPEVVALKEFDRLALTAQFLWRSRILQLRLFLGMTALPQVVAVSDLVSSLGVRIEGALKELGERAALAVEMASAVDRRGLNTV